MRPDLGQPGARRPWPGLRLVVGAVEDTKR